MANVRRRESRGKVVFCVQVRVKGYKAESRTFPTRKIAQEWGDKRESELRYGVTGLTIDHKNSPTLKELTERYVREFGETVWGATIRKRLMRAAIAHKSLSSITDEDVYAFKGELLSKVQPDTARKYIRVFTRAIKKARKKWGYKTVNNPFEDIGLKGRGRYRERTMTDKEYELIVAYLSDESRKLPKREYPKIDVLRIIELAAETAMRRGELVKIKESHISEDWTNLYIPETKTDTPRKVPLSPRAEAILKEQITQGRTKDGYLFPITAKALSRRFTYMCQKLGIEDLHFHDLKHTAVSRYDKRGFSKGHLKNISGHRDDKMLFRYCNADLNDTYQRMRDGC